MAAKKAKKKAQSKPKEVVAAPAPVALKVEAPAAPKETESLRDPVNRKALKEFAASVNKDGKKLVAMANEAPNVYELRRPTGIIELDIDIGGGFPAGGLSIISGPDNAGKTFLMLKAMAMHQKLYGAKSSLAFACAEGAFDYKRALSAGLIIEVPDLILEHWDQERKNLDMPGLSADEIRFYKRQVGEFVVLRAHTGEELLDVVLRAVTQKLFGLIGVDSFSVLLGEANMDKSVGETPKRATNANLMTDFIHKYTPHTSGIFDTNETSLMGIMQVRANEERANAGPLAKYLKEWKVGGAYATRHGKLVDLTIWDGQVLKKSVQGTQQVFGKVLHWKTEKGKAGCHDNVSGEVQFQYDIPAGTDDIGNLIVAGIRRGVFHEERGKVEVYHPVTKEKTDLGGFRSYNEFGKTIAADFEFELQMRAYVLASAGVQCLYRH